VKRAFARFCVYSVLEADIHRRKLYEIGIISLKIKKQGVIYHNTHFSFDDIHYAVSTNCNE